MFIAVLIGFSWFALCIQYSACLTWTKYPDSVTPVWNGTTVTLKWDYSLTTEEQNAANTAITRLWDRSNQSHFTFVASKNFITGQSVGYVEDFAPHITISRSEEATLIINEVAKEDEGVYKFTVRFLTLGDRRISRNFSLEVRVQPTLQCPKKVRVKLGEKANISCNGATGDPLPNITWTKDSHVISHNLTLVIDNVSISDGGTYNVTANNGRTVRVQVELDVLFAPQRTNLTIESNPKNTTLLLNSSLTLLCVTNANPPALYHLYFNESYIGNSSSGEFNDTAKGDGVYTCVPINTMGTGSNDTLNVIAVVPPSVEISQKTVTAVEGDRLNFTCTASGKPKPKIAWTKVGNAIVIADTPSVPVTVDRPGTADNMIQYQCTASNGVETPITATVNITVYYKPAVVLRTNVTTNKTCGTMWVNFTCNSSRANPPVWRYLLYEYHGVELKETNISTLGNWMREVSQKGHWTFYCKAIQILGDTALAQRLGNGTSANNVTLSVYADAYVAPMEDINYTEHENVQRTCNTSETQISSIFWIKVGSNRRWEGKTLNFSSITMRDEGEYRCEAISEKCNNDNQTTFISVHYKPKNVTLKITRTNVCIESAVTFKCGARANPEVEYYQLYENSVQIGNESKYGVWNKTMSKEGEFSYTCEAKNLVGFWNSSSVNVTVSAHPTILSINNPSAFEGSDLILFCNASGFSTTVSWKNVRSKEERRDRNWIFRNITRFDIGSYTCYANNTCDSVNKSIYVNVKYKPSSPTSSKTIDVEEGGVASIPCVEVIGNPPAAISWYRGNATSADNITNRLDLNIKNAAESDTGWYTCFAKNVAGNATVKVLVRVVPRTTPPTVPTTTLAPCPKTPSKNELLLRALIDANCSEWLQVATEFAHTSCGLLRNFNCEHGRSCNSSCGGVVVYFILKFSQPIRGDLVVKTLKEEAKLKKFGRLRVAHESITQIRSSSKASSSEENELLLRALIDANCSERLQVATEFANTSCGLLRNFNCGHGRSLNSSCGGGVEDFLLRFEQPIKGNLVVEFLNEEARLKKFGRLKVFYQSIFEIPSPTTSSASPTKESCLDSIFKDETCKLKWLHIGLLIGFFIGLIVGICLIAWCKYGPTEGAPCCICRRRNCDKCPNRSVSPTQPFSSNHSIPSEGSPQADENSGYHKLGPLLSSAVGGQELETVGGRAIPTHSTVEESKENGKKKDRKAAEQKPTEGPITIGEMENQTTKVDFIGEEAIPTYAAVDKSKKKNKKKEHKPTEDQYAVVDKSKKKKKKNEPDATYAEVDMSKKSIKKQKPGEVLYADLGEFHQMQRMPEVSTSPKTLPPVKRPEAYAETQYADITQFLRGSPGDTGAEPPKDSTTLAVSNSATGSKEESSAGNAGDVEEATNETGF